MNGYVSVDELEVITIKTNETKSVDMKEFVYQLSKRCADIILALLGLILMLPLAIIIKVVSLLLGDKESIFFVQTRIGKDGKEFKIYKFRTMASNSEKILKQLLMQEKYKKEWEEKQKIENDPRVTGIGKYLRKTSLDEIPQMYNLLKGDMSLIGPRPLIKGELESHNGNKEIYESVRPGISGWWACNGRSDTTYEERLELEYYYINNRNFALDCKCVFKTIKVVLSKDGVK